MKKIYNTVSKFLLIIFILNPITTFASSFTQIKFDPVTGERVDNVAPIKVPANTMIRLSASSTYTGKTTTQGQSVLYNVVNDVVVNGAVVIKAGAQAVGNVTEVKKAAVIGQPGKIAITLSSVTAVDGTQVPIIASTVNEGENKMATSVILGLLCILGFVMSGGEGSVQAGSTIDARTMTEVTVNI